MKGYTMKRYLLTAVAAFALASSGIAVAQVGPVGQTAGGAISATNYANNNDVAGFNEQSLSPALVALATSTAQATFTTATGAVATGQVFTTKTNVITTCSGTTGFTLPALQRYTPISVINRSGGSCLIWPSVGATVETALGTDGSTNAPFTMLTNTDVTFRPITPTRWVQ
jgi:hypothetical protein